METSQSRTHPSASRMHGFSLLETMISIVILTVGLLSLAGLMSKMTATTHESRYMGTAALLASEKLEELSRLRGCSPAVAVNQGKTTAGSLTSDAAPDSVTSACGDNETVSYFDEVRISAGNGAVTEIVVEKDSSGNTVYNTFAHTAEGEVQTDQASTEPAQPTSDMLIFKRRWLIEKDPPVGLGSAKVDHVHRITVLTWLDNAPAGSPVSYQTSMVRQVEQEWE